MITIKDQDELFRLIAKNLKEDLSCWAFGGTAMMYFGFKEETKDIDLLFETESERKSFIKAIEKLGFKETSPITIYVPEKLKDKTKPLMFERGDVRFDLFAKKIFRTFLSEAMKEGKGAVHDYKQEKTLSIKVVRSEHIVYLKGITERKKDLKDIKTILEKDSHFDWDVFIDEAVWQHHHGDTWALLDTEKTLKELKDEHFIEEKYLKKLYAVQE
ncbi:hypothetical protein GOV07_02840 [Candidatus Woesearchaeota archaeon]|nr:hypothetical protein [Candidatus Woesearchaeota archaeon]